MGESETTHPYRPEPPTPSGEPARSRDIPWIVRVHVLLGGAAPGLAMFIVASTLSWLLSPAGSAMYIVLTAAMTATLLFHVLRRRRSLRLLQFGRVAYGTLMSKEEIRPRFGNDDGPREYRLGFRFEDRGETYDIAVRTTVPAPLVDDRREQLVFMPEDPLGAELVDALPGRPRVGEDNTVSPGDHAPGATLVLLLLAGDLVAAGIDVFLWLR